MWFLGRWSLPSGEFSVKSLYRRLCEGSLWRFLWQLIRKRLPTNGNIRQRQGPITGRCALCGEHEDMNHIFFECHLARFMWSAVRELLGCSWNPLASLTSIGVYIAVRANLDEYSRSVARLYVGLCGMWGISSPSRGPFQTNPLTFSIKCWLICRCGNQ
jgi:hypothetical protein